MLYPNCVNPELMRNLFQIIGTQDEIDLTHKQRG
jgi:hypothetical protein